jgi:hypothetical protein
MATLNTTLCSRFPTHAVLRIVLLDIYSIQSPTAAIGQVVRVSDWLGGDRQGPMDPEYSIFLLCDKLSFSAV